MERLRTKRSSDARHIGSPIEQQPAGRIRDAALQATGLHLPPAIVHQEFARQLVRSSRASYFDTELSCRRHKKRVVMSARSTATSIKPSESADVNSPNTFR
jgi:hypothetical protein